MPQIAQILVLTFKIFPGGMLLDPPRNFLFFCSLAIPGSDSNNSNNNNDNNNSNRFQRHNLRFFANSLLHHELSLTSTLEWPGCNDVQIMWNTLSTYHMQHVVLRATKEQLSY